MLKRLKIWLKTNRVRYLSQVGQYHDIASLLFLSYCLIGVFSVCLLFGKETEADIYFLSISVSSFVYHIGREVMAWSFFGFQLLAYLTIYYYPYEPFFSVGRK